MYAKKGTIYVGMIMHSRRAGLRAGCWTNLKTKKGEKTQ
jgi:hypothetical protein